VVAAPRALTRGWSYTALSRARAATRLHIDGQDVPAGVRAERAELAPHDARPRPQRDAVLARAAQRMTIRDDEDLAVTQLPTRPAPGRCDDDDLRRGSTAGPERPAAQAEPPAAAPDQRAALRKAQAALVDLAAERAALPLRELREFDAIEQQHAQVRGQRDDVAARLAALPVPRRSVLGRRTKDPHAAQRARLASAVDGADRQLAALDIQRDRLTEGTGGLSTARDERDALDRREGELQCEARELLDRLADRDVVTPPSWARETFGERPDYPRTREHWDRGVRTIARYRIEYDVPSEMPGRGPEPPDQRARTAWRQTATVTVEVQKRLGRSVDRDRGQDRCTSLEL
jgi:hypothetical protein